MSPTNARDIQRTYCAGRDASRPSSARMADTAAGLGIWPGLRWREDNLGRIARRQIQECEANRRDSQEHQR